jgi:hypothetical protein
VYFPVSSPKAKVSDFVDESEEDGDRWKMKTRRRLGDQYSISIDQYSISDDSVMMMVERSKSGNHSVTLHCDLGLISTSGLMKL